jgi:hypothetical protein
MEDVTLLELWKAQEKKLDKTMALNFFMLESMQKQKAQSKLNGLARFKTGAVILGIVWCLFLALLVYGNRFENIYFSTSISAILVFNILAVIVYIKHISLIRTIDPFCNHQLLIPGFYFYKLLFIPPGFGVPA